MPGGSGVIEHRGDVVSRDCQTGVATIYINGVGSDEVWGPSLGISSR